MISTLDICGNISLQLEVPDDALYISLNVSLICPFLLYFLTTHTFMRPKNYQFYHAQNVSI